MSIGLSATQTDLVIACSAIHKFFYLFICINTNNSYLELLKLQELICSEAVNAEQAQGQGNPGPNTDNDDSGMKALRERIVEEMWTGLC